MSSPTAPQAGGAPVGGGLTVRMKARKLYRSMLRRVPEPDVVSHLNITPMMDMMTILLIFFLKNFSVDVQPPLSKDMMLPVSNAALQVTKTLEILVTKKQIIVENRQVAAVKNGEVDASLKRDGQSGFLVTPLLEALQKHASRLKKLEKMGAGTFKGEIMIIADQATPYRLLSEVLYTAGQAEFGKYRLMVLSGG